MYLPRMYDPDPPDDDCSNVIWNDLNKCAACAVVKNGRNKCSLGLQF